MFCVSSISGKSSSKLSRFSQWMVQRRPSSRPAWAITCAPVQTAPTASPRRLSRRSQVSTARLIAAFTLSPPTTMIVASRVSSGRPPSGCSATPLEAVTGPPVSVTTRHS